MKIYTVIAKCRTCKKELNRAINVPENELNRVKLSAPLNVIGSCKHSTLSDLNYHFDLEVIEKNHEPKTTE